MLLLRSISLLFCLAVLFSCSTVHQLQAPLFHPSQQALNYENNLLKFHQEIEQSLAIRKRATDFYRSEMGEGESQYLDAQDIQQIRDVVALYAANREVLLEDIAYFYRDLFSETQFELDDAQATQWYSRKESSHLYQLSINPNDELGRKYIKVLKLSAAAALTLYDNYIIAVLPYERKARFRRSINYDSFEYAQGMDILSDNFYNSINYENIYRVLQFLRQVRKWEKQNSDSSLALDKDNEYFNLLIGGSYYFQQIDKINNFSLLGEQTARIEKLLRDLLVNISQETMDYISMLFGNSLGLVSFRQGYLKDLSKAEQGQIEKALLPGDIILEKTPFRLTDRFIPGYWGHVAIWSGSKQQLMQLGVWQELPRLYEQAKAHYAYEGPSFQSQVEQGRYIIEALRPGVQINTLQDFLNIDDLAVLRDESLSDVAKRRYLLRAFAQIGKDYDFNFDVETDKRIVCSELAFVVYDDYQWPVSKTVGRYTISPDHISKKALGSGPFTPVLLYKSGKKVEKNVAQVFQSLLEQ